MGGGREEVKDEERRKRREEGKDLCLGWSLKNKLYFSGDDGGRKSYLRLSNILKRTGCVFM